MIEQQQQRNDGQSTSCQPMKTSTKEFLRWNDNTETTFTSIASSDMFTIMNVLYLWPLLLALLIPIRNSSAHSASSSSALASSIKFKNPKIDKDKGLSARKNNLGIDTDPDGDDDASKYLSLSLSNDIRSIVSKNIPVLVSRRSKDEWLYQHLWPGRIDS
jgi:hypothetical protein